MAQGIEVLRAVLDGKRVRHHHQLFPRVGEWLSRDELSGFPIWLFHHAEWDIDEPTMAFTEAVAAMDAGQMVECPEIGMQFRRDGDDYVSRPIGGGDWTRGAVFYFGDVHATDWRVVREEPTDARPTLRDARTYLTGMVQAELDATVNNANFVAQWTLQVLLERWPAMFRKEDA